MSDTVTRDPREAHRDLAALANFLDDLPSDRFHMPEWSDKDATAVSCGTAACACGWAATIFQHKGFMFFYSAGKFTPCYRDRMGEHAFAKFFSLGADDAALITWDFYAYRRDYGVWPSKITPGIAAARIREVLARVDPSALVEVGATKPAPRAEGVTA